MRVARVISSLKVCRWFQHTLFLSCDLVWSDKQNGASEPAAKATPDCYSESILRLMYFVNLQAAYDIRQPQCTSGYALLSSSPEAAPLHRTDFCFFNRDGRFGVAFARRWRLSLSASPATSFKAGSSPAQQLPTQHQLCTASWNIDMPHCISADDWRAPPGRLGSGAPSAAASADSRASARMSCFSACRITQSILDCSVCVKHVDAELATDAMLRHSRQC